MDSSISFILNEKQLRNFQKKIKVSDTKFCYRSMSFCHEWIADKNKKGYGRFGIRGKMALAHRLAYFFKHGSIPDGLCVLHRCDNPPCVNPAHLWLGTQADNMRDRDQKRRHVATRGDRNGARLYPERMIRASYPCGSRNGRAYLAESDIPEIFQLRASGLLPREIATIKGVSRQTISRILRREIWTHVTI